MADPMRTIQIHVTRQCNLACLHCYSNSGPNVREALEAERLKAMLTDARGLGYGFISLSGGEPMLYRPLVEVVAHAKALGFKVGLVSNGMFNDARRLAPLTGLLDVMVMSLDGAPARHNHFRANPRAFEVMAEKLPSLRASGIPFGFLYTLSRDNVGEVGWAADFAAAEGAAMLQIHPLDAAGRALEDQAIVDAQIDDDAALAAARAAAAAARRHQGRLAVSVDVQPRLPEHGARPLTACAAPRRFCDLAQPLVVESDGTITPMSHGFGRDFAVGRLGAAPFAQQAKAWMEDGRAARYRALIEATRARLRADDAPQLSCYAHEYRRASHPQPAAA